jgi:pimeloyl-ACP methyl ester carboxylesterase
MIAKLSDDYGRQLSNVKATAAAQENRVGESGLLANGDAIASAMRDALSMPALERMATRMPVGLSIAVGECIVDVSGGPAAVRVTAPLASWQAALSELPSPGLQSVGAMLRSDSGLQIHGEPLARAQCLPLLEGLVEEARALLALRSAPPAPHAAVGSPRLVESLHALQGRYVEVDIDGIGRSWLFEESAGKNDKPVMLFLHTAGADSRQWHGVMTDSALLAQWRTVAFDMPFHGRSSPPLHWSGDPWRLDAALYLGTIEAWFRQSGVERALIVGCSMGAAAGLALLAEHPHRALGAVLLEAPFRSPGRRSQFLDHPGVNGGRFAAAWVQALLSPTSARPRRRRATWIYGQGAPGVYEGDLVFYSDEFDAQKYVARIDSHRTPLWLLTGEYDYSASPEESRRIADAIPGARFIRMPKIGHFPMVEDPEAVLAHLRPIGRSLAGPT